MKDLVPVLIVALVAPAFMAWLTGRQTRKSKEADWARQDLVAERAAEAAAAMLEAAAEGARKLDEIHGLVNSAYTAALQSELNATERERASLMEVIALRRAAGEEPSAESLAVIETAIAKIAELRATLDERARSSHPPPQ